MAEKAELNKSITWMHGAALTIGGVVGAGILALPAVAAKTAGPASLLSWALMGLFSLPMLIAIAGMSSRYPNSGGIAAYGEQAFGSGMGRLAAFLILTGMPTGIPSVALIGANYFGGIFGWSSGAIHILAACTAISAILLNCCGIEFSGRTQVCVVSTILFMLFFVVFSSLRQVSAAAFHPFWPDDMLSIGHAMSLLFFAFTGWEMIGHMAEEFRNPRRDIPITLGAAFAIVVTVYLAIAFVIVGTGAYRAGNPNIAMTTLVGGRWGSSAAAVIGVLGFFVCFCPIQTYSAGYSRLIYSQAREGHLPRFFGELHPSWHTPHRALLLFIPVVLGMLFLSWKFEWDLTPLFGIYSASFLLAYVIGMFAAAKVLESRVGKLSGYAGGALSLVIFFLSGWFMIVPLTVAAVFAARHRKDFFTK